MLLALFALDLAERGHLAGNTVAVTVMTNLGFRLAMEARGIAVRETDVGDRHVLAALDADGLSLGGEQSGHIIFRSRSTTGDGILTGIALADLVQRAGRSLADLSAGLVERVPQRLVNVPIPQPERLADSTEVWEAVVKAEAELGHDGPGPAAPERHRAAGARHGRGAGGGPGRRGRGPARRCRRGRPGADRAAGAQVAWVTMCGIIGVTGESDAIPLLLGALHQLEYRGYDSAGVAMVVEGADGSDVVWRARAAGGTNSVAKLAELTADAPTGHAAAIGHTRWATHGGPTAENAHPHIDCTGRLALIHNGIIENHAELRAELEAAGHTLVSATDTEVLAHLIEQEMAGGATLAEATRTVLPPAPGLVLHRRRLGRRARHHRGGTAQHAPRPRAARRRGVPRLGHPGAHRAHPPRSSRWRTTSWPSSRRARWRSPRSTAPRSSPSS